MISRSSADIHYLDDVCDIVEICVRADQYNIVRGDIIVNTSHPEYGYRSAGMYFFDGTGLIPPDDTYDDYGTVPREFKIVEEFPPGYWDLPSPRYTKRENMSPHNSPCEYKYARGREGLVKSHHTATVRPSWHHINNCGVSLLTINSVREIFTAGEWSVIIFGTYSKFALCVQYYEQDQTFWAVSAINRYDLCNIDETDGDSIVSLLGAVIDAQDIESICQLIEREKINIGNVLIA